MALNDSRGSIPPGTLEAVDNLPAGYEDVVALLPRDRGLRLRPWRAADADAVFAACSEPRAAHWVFRDYTREQAADYVTGAPAAWATRSHLRLCLTDDSDAVLGSADLDDLDAWQGSSDLGWWIAPAARGHGLGGRLGRLPVRAGLDVLGLHRLTATLAGGNTAFRWVAAGAGLRLESVGAEGWREHTGERADREVWRLLATEEPLAPQPELTAGALHLRPWRPADAGAVFAACQDPEIGRWTRLPLPYTPADAREFTARAALTDWARGAGAHFAVLDSVSGVLLGCVGAIGVPASGEVEIGFWAVPAARGRGVTTAATAAMIRWLIATAGVEVFRWRALPGHTASWRVAEKLGFAREGTARSAFVRRGGTGPRLDVVVASLLAADLR